MRQSAQIPQCRTLVLLTFLAGFAWPAAAATDARVSGSYGKLPLHFEANRGQTHKDVRFLSRGPGYDLYLTAGEAVLVLRGLGNAFAAKIVDAAPPPLPVPPTSGPTPMRSGGH